MSAIESLEAINNYVDREFIVELLSNDDLSIEEHAVAVDAIQHYRAQTVVDLAHQTLVYKTTQLQMERRELDATIEALKVRRVSLTSVIRQAKSGITGRFQELSDSDPTESLFDSTSELYVAIKALGTKRQLDNSKISKIVGGVGGMSLWFNNNDLGITPWDKDFSEQHRPYFQALGVVTDTVNTALNSIKKAKYIPFGNPATSYSIRGLANIMQQPDASLPVNMSIGSPSRYFSQMRQMGGFGQRSIAATMGVALIQEHQQKQAQAS